MNAVVDGKGLSQLEFLNGSEDVSGGDEYAREDENVVEDGSDETNSTTNLENEHSFSIDNEQQLNRINIIEQAETSLSHKGSSEPTNNADTNHAANSVAETLSKNVTQASHSPSTQEEHPSPGVLDESRTLSPIHAIVDDDDIIDYSDEEPAPGRSAGSSTVKGDGLKGDSSDSIPAGHALEDTIDYNAGEELEKHSRDFTTNSQSYGQVVAADTDEIVDTQYDEQEIYELNHADLVEAEDFGEIIIDDDAAQTQDITTSGSLFNEKRHGPSEDHRAFEDVADEANQDDHHPAKSAANTHLDGDADHPNSSDITFEDDLDYVSEDAITDKSSNHTSKAREADNPPSPLEDIDQITYEDDDDEITIPDQLDPPKPTSSPPALKRYREDETLPNGTSSGQYLHIFPIVLASTLLTLKLEAKRIRST